MVGAGLLFLCFSAGSSAGALLARRNLCFALAAGCTLVALGAVLLATAQAGAPWVFSVFYGCGLGLSMTSISLLRSRSRPGQRVAELARLNLVWALGAGVAPAILLRTASRLGTSLVLHVAGALFGLFALLVLLAVSAGPSSQTPTGNWLRSVRAAPPDPALPHPDGDRRRERPQ